MNEIQGIKTKKRRKWPVVLAVFAALCIFSAIVGGNDDSPTTSDPSEPVSSAHQPSESATPPIDKSSASSASVTIAFEQEFSSGNYTAGIDFPAGKYDIVAVSGGGNVLSSNVYFGGINAVMGTEDKNEVADIYEQEYKNINLPEGTMLSISGVTVLLSCDAASAAPLTPRSQDITETVDLGNGNFVAGEDFPAGIYNLVAVSGGGNVISSNVYAGGLNAIMGTEDKNELVDMYVQEYKNIDLTEGVSLSISGVKIQLVPST